MRKINLLNSTDGNKEDKNKFYTWKQNEKSVDSVVYR